MAFKYRLVKSILLFFIVCAFTVSANNCYAHAGSLNKVAVKACYSKEKSMACQYKGTHNDLYIGTCQYMATNLMCIRNRPIKKIELIKAKSENGQHHKHESTIK